MTHGVEKPVAYLFSPDKGGNESLLAISGFSGRDLRFILHLVIAWATPRGNPDSLGMRAHSWPFMAYPLTV
jgi:hypothetical protein